MPDANRTAPIAVDTSILRLVTRLNVGGPARHVLELTRATHHRYPTTVAAGRPPAHEGELWDPTIPLDHVPLVRPVSPVQDARAFRAVRHLLRHRRPAILETHMAKAGTIGRQAAVTVTPRPRIIHVFHGHVLSGYFRPSVERAFLAVERRLANWTDAFVAVSPEIRDELVDLGVGRVEQWHVLPLGLDLLPYLAVPPGSGSPGAGLRAELGIPEGAPLVGAIGRLAPIKDLDVLLRAVARLEHVHVALVGDGPDRARLQTVAAELGVGERTHFTGLRSDVPDVLAELDVVVLTSRNEGTPMALIEALAASRPVVATRVGGVPAVIQDGTTGLLVSPGDDAATAEAIRRLLEDRDSAESFAAAGRADVRARYGLERMVAEMTALYDDLLGRS